MITNKKAHSIYLIDKYSILKNADEMSDKEISVFIERFMGTDKEYKIQTLKDGIDLGGFKIQFYFKPERRKSKIAKFCESFIAEDQNVLNFQSASSSSIMFVWNKKYIYAITTGQGYRMVENYCVPKFGLIVTSLFDNKFKITSLDSNVMSSTVHSTKTVYSKEVEFNDANTLDMIYKEVIGRLNDSESVRNLLNLKNKIRLILL